MMTEVQKIFNEKIAENIGEYRDRNNLSVVLQNFGDKIFVKISYQDHTSMRKFIFPREGGGLIVNIQYISEPNKLVTAETRIFSERFLEETLEKGPIGNFMNSVSSESLFENKVNLEKLLEIKEWLSKNAKNQGVSVEELLNLEFSNNSIFL